MIKAIKGAINGMKAIRSIQEFLSGKKTYLAGAALAVPALVEVLLAFADGGIKGIPGILKSETWMQLMAGVMAMTGRAAIAKAGSQVNDPNYPDNKTPTAERNK